MTIDDESSIYIGGLPYEATEQTLRRVFDPYGHVIAVKIINDRGTRGKCYGFVTFEDPRSAIDAIGDMDGRTIGGRVVRVNGVKTRGGRSDFDRESFQQESESGRDWDRGRDRDRRRERDHDHERERFRDRSDDRLRDHDRSREYDSERERGYGHVRDHDRARDGLLDRDQDRDIDLKDDDIEKSRDRNRNWGRDHVRDHDRARDVLLDRDRDQDIDLEDDDIENSRNRNRNWGRDHDFDSDRDREMTRDNEHGKFVETDSKRKSRKSNGSVTANGHSREIWSSSNNHYNEQVEEELLRSSQRLEELKREIMQTEEGLEHTGTLVSELQQKSKKLEDLLIDAKKTTSYRKTQLTKLHKCFLQVEDYTEKLKSSERELQALVDGVVSEDIGNAVLRGGMETDGKA